MDAAAAMAEVGDVGHRAPALRNGLRMRRRSHTQKLRPVPQSRGVAAVVCQGPEQLLDSTPRRRQKIGASEADPSPRAGTVHSGAITCNRLQVGSRAFPQTLARAQPRSGPVVICADRVASLSAVMPAAARIASGGPAPGRATARSASSAAAGGASGGITSRTRS